MNRIQHLFYISFFVCAFMQNQNTIAHTAPIENQEGINLQEDSFEESLYDVDNDFDSITLNSILFSHSDGRWTIWLNDTEISSEQSNSIRLCKKELLITEVTQHHVKLMNGNEEITLHPRQTFRFDRQGKQRNTHTTTSSMCDINSDNGAPPPNQDKADITMNNAPAA